MPRPDDERQEDLGATSESLEADARDLLRLEEQKQGLDVDDPRVDALSRDAERLATDIATKSRIERDIANEDDAEPPDAERSPH